MFCIDGVFQRKKKERLWILHLHLQRTVDYKLQTESSYNTNLGLFGLYVLQANFSCTTSASVDNTLLDLLNSSYPTQSHSLIAN